MLLGTVANGTRTHMVRPVETIGDYRSQRTECCKYGPPNTGIQTWEGPSSKVDCLICRKTRNFRRHVMASAPICCSCWNKRYPDNRVNTGGPVHGITEVCQDCGGLTEANVTDITREGLWKQ